MSVSLIPESLLYDRTLSSNALRYYDLIRKDPSLPVLEAAARLGITDSAAYKLERTLIKRGYLSVTKVWDAGGERRIREFRDKERAS